ncbi:QacE family quaternary ammonium compound efflux SMR transporter [Marinomonas sp. E8]|uniref:QacE family quaternary ammonium compound efflux SMR transporter n=2 Tax=Marinomonas algarum TaxID=2883105 RepID=A0A9X1IQN3_9GAMM|nr:SMR family transporter [Marinomonas algarum]MCB5162741.1 QacE family quaternary ammonium compound efflux SMR transporter [Marinomonas algarum]
MTYVILLLAIVSEVIATSALKASDSFSKLGPSLIVVVGYVFSFYLLTIVMRSMPTGMAYAIWAGLGVVLVSLFGYFFANEKLDFAACLGMSLIVLGVVVINVFSKTVSH